jgi:molecular chaperone DnaJ
MQNGHTVRLRGKGVPHLQGRGRGDLVVELVVATPTDLSAEEEDLIRRLAALRGEQVAEPESGFLARLKSAFR